MEYSNLRFKLFKVKIFTYIHKCIRKRSTEEVKSVRNIHWRQTGMKSGGAEGEFETYLVKFRTY